MQPATSSETQVLILCGGRGTRLASVVQDLPKPMAPISDRPFLAYLLEHVRSEGFLNIALLTGYRAEMIQDYFGNGSNLGVHLTYSHEETPLGTGGAIRDAIRSSSFSRFLCLNGDTYFQTRLASVAEAYLPGRVCVGLRHEKDTSRYGTVVLDSSKSKGAKISRFLEKSASQSGGQAGGLINAGVYAFDQSLIKYVNQEGAVSLEIEVFPDLATRGLLDGVVLEGKFIDIGIPSDYQYAQTHLKTWMADR